MLMLGVFLFNLLCGLVPCDPDFGKPKLSSKPYPEIGFRDGRPGNKTMIPAKVATRAGIVEGYHMRTLQNRVIFAFEGIPYGKAGRWQSPVPWKPWKGSREAKKPGNDCLQLSAAKFLRVHGSEDCLYVNVFTPDLPFKGHNPKYAVLVYFHSGSFLMGSGSEHGPTYLLDEDVILVTVNYRLGPLGFLSTGDEVIPGNYGLKDQALAIQWVYDNIELFGGDKNNINLMGYSAGGVSVHLHMISNKTRHLFQRGLSLGTGSAFQHWGFLPTWRARAYTNKLARRFGCPTEESSQLASCLRNVNSNFLVMEQMNMAEWFPFPGVFFAPTTEPQHPEAFLTETPEEAYARDHVAKKPWITSTTSDEGITAVLVLELFMRWLPFRLSWRAASAKAYLDYGYITEHPEEITEKVTKYYLGNKSPLFGTQREFGKMMTHRYFHFGLLKGIQAHSQVAPTYAYYFSFMKARYSMGNMYGHNSWEWPPGHNEDDYYLLNCTTQHPGFSEKDPEYQMTKTMTNFIENFVYDGVPAFLTEEGEFLDVWEPITDPSNIRMLNLDQEVKMIDYPDKDQIRFWQSLNLKDAKLFRPI